VRWSGSERSARGGTPSEGPQGATLRELREGDARASRITRRLQ